MVDRTMPALLRSFARRLTSLERRLARAAGGGGSGGGMPAGSIAPYAGQFAPAGWLFPDGSAVSRATFPGLFAAIGTTYGAGNGSTTFNLPNLIGRVPVGRAAGDPQFGALGQSGGAKTHTLGLPEVPRVTGSVAYHGGEGGSNMWNAAGAFGGATLGSYRAPASGSTPGASSMQTLTFDNGGGGGSHNNLQPYLVVNYIIKT